MWMMSRFTITRNKKAARRTCTFKLQYISECYMTAITACTLHQILGWNDQIKVHENGNACSMCKTDNNCT